MNQKVDFPCPICNSINFRIVRKDELGEEFPVFGYDFSAKHRLTYRIVECRACSHRYATPRHQNIWESYKDVRDDNYLANEEQYFVTFSKVADELAKVKPFGNLLDVGCSTGIFLTAAKKYYQVEGLELSEWAIELAEKKQLTIHKCLLKDMPVNKKYDLITMWGVIEHFEYPLEDIKYISNLLKQNGIVALWTGDVNSITAKFLGQKWWYYQGQHIQMFTKHSLIEAFQSNGFKLLGMKTFPYVMALRSINKSLARYPIIHKITKPLLTAKIIADWKITIQLPGEMFAFFQKV